MKWKYFWCTFI